MRTYQIFIKGDEAFAKRKQGVQKNELNEQLKDYINQWRDERYFYFYFKKKKRITSTSGEMRGIFSFIKKREEKKTVFVFAFICDGNLFNFLAF